MITPADGEDLRLSAVIPSFHEALSAPQVYERLSATFRDLGVDYEIIFVNSGSTDDTREVLAELAARDPRVTVINHTRAFGPHSAFTSGMRLATGDAVILLDGDLQDPPELIPELVSKWREGYEVVYGERTRRQGSLPMRAAYRLFYRVFKRLSYVTIPLDAGEFSLLDRRVVDAINALPETQRFVRGLRAWVGFRQIGVPYTRPERAFGRSSRNYRRNFGMARSAILSFSYVPLDAIGWLALLTTALSSVGMVGLFVLRLVAPGAAPRGFTTLIILILFIGGIQLLCLSVIGSYLAQMYEEVKARPPYLIDDVINDPRNRDQRELGPSQRRDDDGAALKHDRADRSAARR